MKKTIKNDSAAAKPVMVNNISVLVVEICSGLEKIVNEKLFAWVLNKNTSEPFWRIALNENMQGTICTVYHYPNKNELGFWCTHVNCIPGLYPELRKKLKESAQGLGLSLIDLNPQK